MGVDDGIRGLFLIEVIEQLQEYSVFQHIGVIARVKSVTVTKHGGMRGAGKRGRSSL
jgi:hypothetical protein